MNVQFKLIINSVTVIIEEEGKTGRGDVFLPARTPLNQSNSVHDAYTPGGE